MPSHLVELGDGPTELRCLILASVDLVLTDPPSGQTAAPFDKPMDPEVFWPAVWHALKPDGVAVVFASGIQFAARLIASEPKAFRYDLVWRKNLPTGFHNAKVRQLRNHEFVLVFARKVGLYIPQMQGGHLPITANRKKGESHSKAGSSNYGAGAKSTPSRVGATDRYPRSVLEFPGVSTNSRDRIHPQQKPEGLLTYLVRTYSRPGDLVVDPYAGSGSTGRVALKEGRRFLGWDNDRAIVRRANGRRSA